MPTGTCSCGCEYKYVKVKDDCCIRYPPPRCGYKRPLFSLHCTNNNPDCVITYDGTEDGLFHYSDVSCVSLVFLYACAEQFNHDGKTQAAYVFDLQLAYKQHMSSQFTVRPYVAFCSVPHFRQVYQAFLAKLDRQYLFRCPLCGDSPPVMVGDATAESIQAGRYHGESITQLEDDSIDAAPRPHTRAQRCVLSAAADRQLLGDFATSVRTDERSAFGHQRVGADDERFVFEYGSTNLEDLLRTATALDMSDMVQDIVNLQYRLDSSQQRVLAKMLGSMATDSPVSSYFPYTVAVKVKALLDQSQTPVLTAELQELLQNQAPLFFEFCTVLDALHESTTVGQAILNRYRAFVIRLVTMTVLCGTGGPALTAFEFDQQQPAASRSDICLKSGLCVGVGLVRHRPKYERDKEKDTSNCRHQFISGSHGSKPTGGIFTWFCQHGVCYPFDIIPNAEGRNEAFSFLLKYFKVAPKVVIYDFACSLQDYCLNRQPEHFRDTMFLVDRFHWFNHVSCARSYNLSLYSEFMYLNSQIAAQCNSALTRIKCSVSQMKQTTFMSNISLFLEMWNQRKMDKLQAAQDHVSRLNSTLTV